MALRHETRDTLWTLIAPPTIWAAHFLLSYITAAYGCAPNDGIFAVITGVRLLIAGLTVAALLAIGFIGTRAYREWRRHGGATPHDGDSAEVRERFLEFSTVLLAALSFVAVVYTALPALLIVDCR